MKTLLDVIKRWPQRSIASCERRASTSTSSADRVNHQLLAVAIAKKDWEVVEDIISSKDYTAALEGIITCLNYCGYDTDFTADNHMVVLRIVRKG